MKMGTTALPRVRQPAPHTHEAQQCRRLQGLDATFLRRRWYRVFAPEVDPALPVLWSVIRMCPPEWGDGGLKSISRDSGNQVWPGANTEYALAEIARFQEIAQPSGDHRDINAAKCATEARERCVACGSFINPRIPAAIDVAKPFSVGSLCYFLTAFVRPPQNSVAGCAMAASYHAKALSRRGPGFRNARFGPPG